MSQSDAVMPIRSHGSNCAGWCGAVIQQGDRAIRVRFEVPVVFTTMVVDRELCKGCAEVLMEKLKKALQAIKGARG